MVPVPKGGRGGREGGREGGRGGEGGREGGGREGVKGLEERLALTCRDFQTWYLLHHFLQQS